MAEKIITNTPKRKYKRHMRTTKSGELAGWWVKFFDRINGHKTMPLERWSEYEVFGYICQRYRDAFGHEFYVAMAGSTPSKNQDLVRVREMVSLLSATPFFNKNFSRQYIKDYIDWVFDIYIIPGKVKLTSIGYFTTISFINSFRIYRAENNKVTRSSTLPKTYIELAKEHGLDIATYGDLAYLKLALDGPNANADYLYEHRVYLAKIVGLGFDIALLDNMENS